MKFIVNLVSIQHPVLRRDSLSQKMIQTLPRLFCKEKVWVLFSYEFREPDGRCFRLLKCSQRRRDMGGTNQIGHHRFAVGSWRSVHRNAKFCPRDTIFILEGSLQLFPVEINGTWKKIWSKGNVDAHVGYGLG